MTELPEFTERERGLPETDVPQALVWRQIRRDAQREQDARAALRTEWRRRADLAADVARARHEIGRFRDDTAVALHKAGVDADVLDVLTERLAAALGRAGFRSDDPIGRRWPEVLAWADALPGTRPDEDLVVSETVEPAVSAVDGELVARALVVLGPRENGTTRNDGPRADDTAEDGAHGDRWRAEGEDT